MEIKEKVIIMHGGHEIHVLSPIKINSSITSGHDHKGYFILWGNGSGYKLLAECFSLAAELNKDEIIYIHNEFEPGDEFKQVFSGCEYKFGIVLTNYCETQLSTKEIDIALKAKVYSERNIIRYPTIKNEYVDRWKTYRRLTVKVRKQNMFISTNRDGFDMLSCAACDMAEYGDKYYEDLLPHRHFDWDENTSTSVGVTLYHWHNK